MYHIRNKQHKDFRNTVRRLRAAKKLKVLEDCCKDQVTEENASGCTVVDVKSMSNYEIMEKLYECIINSKNPEESFTNDEIENKNEGYAADDICTGQDNKPEENAIDSKASDEKDISSFDILEKLYSIYEKRKQK